MKTNQQDDYTRIDIRLISIYQLLRWNQSGILKTDLCHAQHITELQDQK